MSSQYPSQPDKFYSKEVDVARLIRGLNADARSSGFPVRAPIPARGRIKCPAATELDDAVDAAPQGDCAKALRGSPPLAESGDARAQFDVGFLREQGWGAARDLAETIKWYRKAADHDSREEHLLGMAYLIAGVVLRDDAEGARWHPCSLDKARQLPSAPRRIVSPLNPRPSGSISETTKPAAGHGMAGSCVPLPCRLRRRRVCLAQVLAVTDV